MLIIIIGFFICLQLTYWYPDSLQSWAACEVVIILLVLLGKFIKNMLGYCPKCHKFWALEDIDKTHIRNETITKTIYKNQYDVCPEEERTSYKVYHVTKECKYCKKYRKIVTEYK